MSRRSILLATTVCVALVSLTSVDQASAFGGRGGTGGFGGGGSAAPTWPCRSLDSTFLRRWHFAPPHCLATRASRKHCGLALFTDPSSGTADASALVDCL